MSTTKEEIKGYKVFNPDWTCRGFQFEVGKTFEEAITPIECAQGFHFCEKAVDCFNYYSFNPNNKVAEVIAIGEIDKGVNKIATNKLHIVREIPWQELLEIVNTGSGNSGLGNTGNENTGNENTGNWNTGNWNTGNRNTGNENTGNRNTGNENTGNRNTGNENTGNWNTGNRNTGNENTGNRNTGNRNTGDFNAGDYNISDGNAGCFNTKQHTIKMFDKNSNLTLEEWRLSKAYKLLRRVSFMPTTWVWSSEMTKEEKAAHPTHETTGGYLRENDLSNVYQNWWSSLTDVEKAIIVAIPNFDADKFKMVTGVTVNFN